jgi:hypothetical protein
MALRQLKSVAYDDEELYDRSRGMLPDYDPPEYPCGLCFCVSKADLEKAGGEGGEPGATMRFSAMGEVTNTFQGIKDCRIEVELTQFAGEDGKFFDLEKPANICFQGPELEKVEMSDNAERGDMVHLIGEARLESITDSEYADCPMASLQIISMTYEDESAESREG